MNATIAKPFALIAGAIQASVLFLLNMGFQRNRRHFYGRYFGTDNWFVLFVKNIFRPRRFLTKLSYGQILRLPSFLSFSSSVEDMPTLPAQWQDYIETLNRDGVVFMPGYFQSTAGILLERYKLNSENFPPSDQYYRFSLDLNDPDIFQVATESMLLTILAKYYGCQPYLRHYPGINCTHLGGRKELEAAGFNDFWHYDTVNQMTAHILLKDITKTDSCMIYAKGSHRRHREHFSHNDYYYSEEYMRDHFEIISCVGDAGTLVVFDPNGLHRADLNPGTFRSHLHLNFVPGNDLVKLKEVKQTEFSSHAKTELARKSSLQLRSVEHLISIEA